MMQSVGTWRSKVAPGLSVAERHLRGRRQETCEVVCMEPLRSGHPEKRSPQ